MLSVPILFITFNRPQHTRRVLETILTTHPLDLYVFQDGARVNNTYDIKACKQVRDCIESLTTTSDITLHTLFSDTNLGCGPGPAAAINWFFQNEEMGIILEDDAIPNSDFFGYCEELLTRYKDDESIRAIGSMKILQEKKYGDGSYYFSMMNRNLCAWATWRRAWKDFDIAMSGVTRSDLKKTLKWYGCNALEKAYWCDRLDEVHKDLCKGQSWDMQFLMSIWLNHGKGIIPNVNLSSNIGTIGEGTHLMQRGNVIDNLPTHPILPLCHPSTLTIEREADRCFHYVYFEPQKKNWNKGRVLYHIINKEIKRIVGHSGPWRKHK